jgi:hypothetical protein
MDDNEHDWCPANSISIRKKWLSTDLSKIGDASCDVCGRLIKVRYIDCGGKHKNTYNKPICKHQDGKCYHFYISNHKRPGTIGKLGKKLIKNKIERLDKRFDIAEKAKRKLYQEK